MHKLKKSRNYLLTEIPPRPRNPNNQHAHRKKLKENLGSNELTRVKYDQSIDDLIIIYIFNDVCIMPFFLFHSFMN